MKREVVKLMRVLVDQGWHCGLTKKGHWRCTSPSGALYFMSQTPSDHRSLKNARADLRRMGAEL